MVFETVLIGNLGAAPEMRYLDSGDAMTVFNVAHTDRYTNKTTNKVVENTVWVRVVVYGRQAVACNEYLDKGKLVYVKGTMIFDPNTHGPKMFQRGNGEWSTKFELKASEVKFLSAKGERAKAEDDGEVAATTEEIPW